MRRALSILPLLLLVACKGNREKEVVGTWTSPKGLTISAAQDKTYHDEGGVLHEAGTWQMEGEDIVFTPKTIRNKPVAELKTRLEQNVGRIPPARRPFVEKMIRDIDRPNYLTLSADGRTLTTNRAKDQNEDPWPPLTKTGS